jgi:hypothetical protein
MYPRPVEANYRGDFRIEVLFEDGVRAELDFSPAVQRGGLFSPLRDFDEFRKARIDPEAQTIVWPNGADVCPDVLYHLATGAALPGDVPDKPALLVRVQRPTTSVK